MSSKMLSSLFGSSASKKKQQPQQQQQQQQQQQPLPAKKKPTLLQKSMPPPPPPQQQRPRQRGSSAVRLVGREGDGDLIAVIVSLRGGSSYDSLFTDVKQKMDGGVVAVYAVDYEQLDGHALGDVLSGSSAALGSADRSVVEELQKDIAAVDPECVLFNFECCSSCEQHSGFRSTEYSPHVLRAVRKLLDGKHMVMFSDFSLKALLGAWDTELLGPKVAEQKGEHSHEMKLRFDPQNLKDCVSHQLAAVGELCPDGTAVVHAMGGTIVYDLIPDAVPADGSGPYVVEQLTRITSLDGRRANAAGHTLLTYRSGGCMLLSSGHWIELSKLNASDEGLERVICEQEGAEAFQEWKAEYVSAAPEQQVQMKAQRAQQAIWSSAPCQYQGKKKASRAMFS